MKIAVLYGKWCLTARGSLPFDGHRQDPRGLSGSELGFIRISQELAALGHDVTAYTVSPGEFDFEGVRIRQIDQAGEIDSSFDAAISINEPELLRGCKAKVRAVELWLNSFEYNAVGFEKHVDLWLSPSQGHLDMVMGSAHDVALGPDGPGALFTADPNNWVVLRLGCDPERYQDQGADKVPGRVVYCSSPDRGLHWLLQEWPAIKRAVPYATLKIFYRLQAWIDGFSDVAYSPPIEMLRARAVYVREALLRMSGPDWGITVCDSVSRERIEREMCEAEVLAYPCDTVRWSEGFSCTILEGCAARACPVILDCDALGDIYREACVVLPSHELAAWRDAVIRCLQDSDERQTVNAAARSFAERHTWRYHARRLTAEIYRVGKL